MARINFGGGGSSSLFSSLFRSSQAAAKARQAANDKDMEDQWINGQITDAAWLAYIAQRVEQTAGQPTEHADWLKYQRDYTRQINDKQAEDSYKTGAWSLTQLINYYQTELGTLTKGSLDYSNLQVTIAQYQDQRAQQDIVSGAQAITNKIDAGTATNQDLLNFYKSQLALIPQNDPFAKQVRNQIAQVQDTIEKNNANGAIQKAIYDFNGGRISGANLASQLRNIANHSFKNSDPATYYQLLDQAQTYSMKYPGFVSSNGSKKSAEVGGGGRSGGRGSGRGGPETRSLNETLQILHAQLDVAKSLSEQAGRGLKIGIDPVTGQQIALTPQLLSQVDQQIMTSYDAVSRTYMAKNEPAEAAAALADKANYITTTVVKRNTDAFNVAEKELLTATTSQLKIAGQLADPYAARAMMQQIAAAWSKLSQSTQTTATTADQAQAIYNQGKNGASATAAMNAAMSGQPNGPLQMLNGASVQRAQAFANALITMANPGATVDQLNSAAQLLGANAPATYGKLANQIASLIARPDAVAQGEVEPIVNAQGQTVWLPTVLHGGGVTFDPATGKMVTAPPQPTVDLAKLHIPKGGSLVTIMMDINGKPTPRQAVAVPTDLGMTSWYTHKSITYKAPTGQNETIKAGTLLTPQMIAGLNGGTLQDYVTHGDVIRGPAQGANFLEVNYGGHTWYQDEGTKMWYRDTVPVKFAQVGPGGGIVGPIEYNPNADAAGVPIPYEGTNPQAAQQLVDSGAFASITSQIKGRDINGNIVPETSSSVMSAYYDPLNTRTNPAATRDSWWNDDIQAQKAQAIAQQQIQAKQQADAQAAARGNAGRIYGEAQSAINQNPTLGRDSWELPTGSSPFGQLGKMLGINLDGSKPAPGVPLPARPQALSNGDVAMPGAKPSSAPIVQLPKPEMPNASSGPSMTGSGDISMPGAKASKLTLPPIKLPGGNDTGSNANSMPSQTASSNAQRGASGAGASLGGGDGSSGGGGGGGGGSRLQ